MLRQLIYKFAAPIYRSLSSTTIPFETIDSQTLLPKTVDQTVLLRSFKRKWGDLSGEKSLMFLCSLVKIGYTPVFEFGTYRGRTVYNLALNTKGEIYTLDLGEHLGTNSDISANISRHPYDSYHTGELFYTAPAGLKKHIIQIIGDSMTTDLSKYYNKMKLVFVDGGHTYTVCMNDSLKALKLVKKGGIIVWDDYGSYWSGVQKAVNELSRIIKLYYLEREQLVIYINK